MILLIIFDISDRSQDHNYEFWLSRERVGKMLCRVF
jgi:hypothetical protein